MASYVHRSTLRLHASVDGISSGLEGNPDYLKLGGGAVSAVKAIPQKYRKIVAEAVVEMEPAEKAAVDAALDATRIASLKQQLQDAIDNDDFAFIFTKAGLLEVILEIEAIKSGSNPPARTLQEWLQAIKTRAKNLVT